MNLAENLLNSLPNTTYTATETASVVEEPHIIIDENRNIIVPQQLKNIAVTGDKNVETVTFDCVRYWDGNDLSTFAIYLNYELPNGEKGSFAPTSIRRFDTFYSFDWTIGSSLTKAVGSLTISLTAKETDGSSLLKQWGSFTNSDMRIVLGGSVTPYIPDEEEQDILSQVLSGLNDKLSIESVVQTTGYSETEVMSQKAVTGCVATLDARISDRISANSDRISANSDRLTNIEAGLPSSVWHVDDTAARVKDVPENARPYAMISEIGGMTYNVNGVLRDAKVTAVESVGANLISFPYVNATQTTNGITWTLNDDGTVTVNGTATEPSYFAIRSEFSIENGDYCISGAPSGYLGNITIYVIYDNQAYATDYGNGQAFAISQQKIIYIGLSVGKGVTVSNAVFKPMLNKGSTALPYSPYFKNTFPIPEAVQALDGYGQGISKEYHNKIVLDPAEGVKKFLSKVRKFVFNGSEGWNTEMIGDVRAFTITVENILGNGHGVGLVNHDFKIGFVAAAGYSYIAGGRMWFYVDNHTMTVTEWKSQLAQWESAGNALTAIWAKATPTETDISDYFGDDNLIGVEGGGTLTFENEHRYDMPNTVTYMLKEVSA